MLFDEDLVVFEGDGVSKQRPPGISGFFSGAKCLLLDKSLYCEMIHGM